MTHKQGSLRAAIYTAMALLLILAAVPATAQLSDDADWVEMSNRYLNIQLGISGNFKYGDETWDIPGRWMVATAEGDPETDKDNRHALLYFPRNLSFIVPCYYFGFIKAKIGDKVNMIGDHNTGYWSKRPYSYVTPPPGYGAGRTGGYIEGEWTFTDGGTAVAALNIRMSIVRDQCRFEFTIVNRGTTAQNIGLQLTGDVLVDENCSTAFPYVPGFGFCHSTATAPRPFAQVFSGTNVPNYYDTYDSVENPTVVARNTLRLQDCTVPDHLILGEFGELASATSWMPDDFNPDYFKPINDLTWALTWNPRMIVGGGYRKIITYYGVGAADAVWNYKLGTRMQPDHVALALSGPRSLKYDSTVPGTNDLSPSPFTVKAYLYNMATDPGPYDLENVTVTLYLPPGLELTQAPQQTAQQAIGRVPISSEALPVSWTVQATGEYSGELEYFVTARAQSGWQQVVSRKIMVPATKKLAFRSGWQLMHVPFTFNNPTIEHAFGLTPGTFHAMYWDPVLGRYGTVNQLTPGQSFWMYVNNVAPGRTQPHRLSADAAIVGEDFGKQTREQYVDLAPGWNLIGNPFVYPVYWGQVLVQSRTDLMAGSVSLDEAVKKGWLSKTLFSWVPESGTYENFKDNDRLLLPWRGYWVRARYPITLVFRPSVPPASDVTSNPGGF